MKKIYKEKDDWGQNVIYVEECNNFDYEKQPDIPILNMKMQEKNKVYIKSNRLPDLTKFDIM